MVEGQATIVVMHRLLIILCLRNRIVEVFDSVTILCVLKVGDTTVVICSRFLWVQLDSFLKRIDRFLEKL